MFLGTIWSSIKQIKTPYVFDWENAIALHGMQGNWASFRGEGEVSWVFSSCGRNRECSHELLWGCPFKTRVCSAKSGHLSRYDGQLRNVNKAWQDNTDASGGQGGDQAFFYTWHSATGIPINFEEESGFVTF